jgi:hypothetical protein
MIDPWKNSTVVKWRLNKPSSSKSGGFLHISECVKIKALVRKNPNAYVVKNEKIKTKIKIESLKSQKGKNSGIHSFRCSS